MATSPNFGWLEPDNTDLVKNGALAIRTLGNAIDASMADLKGGTTGQVLSKASGTDMDFTWTAVSVPTSLGYAAGKNKIINGDFLINQRAFTTSTSSGLYPADRTVMFNAGGTCTTSRQDFTPGTAPVAGYEGRNFIRAAISGQSASTDYYQFRQHIEDVTNFAGQTVTLSFWAKANSGTPSIAANFVQNFGTGGSPSGATFATTAQKTAITTSWARYSLTFAIASIAGKTLGTNANTSSLELRLYLSAGSAFNSETSTLGIQTNTFDIWGVQVEAGSTATAFQTASGGSPQAELAMCQRYLPAIAASNGEIYTGQCYSTTAALIPVVFPVTARVAPTGITVNSAGNFRVRSATASKLTTTAINFSTGTVSGGCIEAVVASGLVAGNATNLFNESSGTILFTGCEL